MMTMRRIPEKFGRRSSDRPTVFDLVNTDFFSVDKGCAVGYGGSAFAALRRDKGNGFRISESGAPTWCWESEFPIGNGQLWICRVFFDIAGEAGLTGKRATARGTGRGVDCRESAIHPARSEPHQNPVSNFGSRFSGFGFRRVKKYAYVRLWAGEIYAYVRICSDKFAYVRLTGKIKSE
jgi:hypothetical protein